LLFDTPGIDAKQKAVSILLIIYNQQNLWVIFAAKSKAFEEDKSSGR